MRLLFFFLFLTCTLYGTVSAQTGFYPLTGGSRSTHAARTEATTTPTPYINTLKLPYFYDFASRYLQIDSFVTSTTVATQVYTLRPHGLVTGDAIQIRGERVPTDTSVFKGIKYAKRIDNYQFDMYEDAALTTPTTTNTTVDYLRISKVGAQETIIPDTLAFYDNQSGVQVNPGFGKNQPSYYVAAFDGVDHAGFPYNTSNPLATGYTDSLLSQPFDFSSYLPSDNIYMSFYYQHGGYGEEPDAGDHLYLEFLDQDSVWHVVKDVTGATGASTDSFYAAIVPVTDPLYLWNKFQYRFRSYGRQSGAYDAWSIDYIYLDKNRNANDTTIIDFAIRNGETSFLKTYTAMPFAHFFDNITAHVKPTLSFVMTHQKLFVGGKPKVPEIDITTNQFQDTIAHYIGGSDVSVVHEKTYTSNPLTYTFPDTTQATYVDVAYLLSDGQRTDNASPAPFDMAFNNLIVKRTFLYNYYAYDDSEAEIAFGTNLAGTQIASQFTAEKSDYLTDIDICFTESKGPRLEGSQIYLNVWDANFNLLNEVGTNPPTGQVIAIHYQNYLNGFTRYTLTHPILLAKGQTFSIGYKQNLTDLLTLGYDRDNDASGAAYYNENGTWYTVASDPNNPTGSMMMRPVFYHATDNIPVGIQHPSDASKNELMLYPNPASSTIRIVSKDDIQRMSYSIYSLYGQSLLNGEVTAEENSISISSLNSGMYMIQCTDEQHRMYTSRFVKE